MRFEVNDVVVCNERPGHIGRVLRVRRGAGLIRVAWSKQVVSWHDDESLRMVDVSANCQVVPAKVASLHAGSGSKSGAISLRVNKLPDHQRTCNLLLAGQITRPWFSRMELSKLDGDRAAAIAEIRDRAAVKRSGWQSPRGDSHRRDTGIQTARCA